MTLTEIRNVVIRRMTTQTAIAQDAVDYPNGPVFPDPSVEKSGRVLLTSQDRLALTKIGAGPTVHRTGVLIIQLFVPVGSGTLQLTQATDKLTQLFRVQGRRSAELFLPYPPSRRVKPMAGYSSIFKSPLSRSVAHNQQEAL